MEYLGDIYAGVQAIVSFMGILAGGVVLTYYILPYIAESVHGNVITLVWVLVCLAVWEFYLGAGVITPLVTMMQYFFSYIVYTAIPYEYASGLVDVILTVFALWTVKIALFPKQHHESVTAAS